MTPARRSLLVALVAGCCSLPGVVAGQSPDPSAGGALLRIVVPPIISPLLDVYVDGLPLTGLQDFTTGSVSAYSAIPVGKVQIDVYEDGTDAGTADPLASATAEVQDGDVRTMAVRGDGSVLMLDDVVSVTGPDTSSPPASGTLPTAGPASGVPTSGAPGSPAPGSPALISRAYLRLIDLDTSAGPVDAWLGDLPLVEGLTTDALSAWMEVDSGTATLTATAPGDRLSLFASEDVMTADGTAVSAFMVPTGDRTVWFLAVDPLPGPVGPGPSPTPTPAPTATTDPDALEWRSLPVYECELMIAFTTDGESTGTRRTGNAEVRVASSLRGGLALYQFPVTTGGNPLTGWALGPDDWTCVRHLGGDFDTFVSGLTIRSRAAGRAAAASCNGFSCEPAVGSSSGRFIAYGSMVSGAGDTPPSLRHGVPGTTACAYHRRFRSEGYAECTGVRARTGGHAVPRRAVDGSTWVSFDTTRGDDTVVGAVGIGCSEGDCTPHLIECKLRPEDRDVCDRTLRVMLDPDLVRVPHIDAHLACPGSVALIRAGSDGQPPLDYAHARVVRTLRGDHDLVVDAVPVASTGSEGDYSATCRGEPDRLWYRIRSVDGDRVNGWMAMPLVAPISSD